MIHEEAALLSSVPLPYVHAQTGKQTGRITRSAEVEKVGRAAAGQVRAGAAACWRRGADRHGGRRPSKLR